MPGYSYAPSGAGAAYLGMMGHLGPMRESRGPSPYGAASHGMYGGRPGTDTNRGYMQRPDPRSSGYKPLSSAPRGSSMFSSSASGDRSSQHSSRSPHTPSLASRSSGPSNTPRGSSLFSSSASGSRGSQHPLSSPYSSRSSSYNAPWNTPRGSSLFDPSTSGNSRGSQHSSRSRSSASPYSSGSSGYPGYRSSKSFMTDYPPRGGWFPSYGYR